MITLEDTIEDQSNTIKQWTTSEIDSHEELEIVREDMNINSN